MRLRRKPRRRCVHCGRPLQYTIRAQENGEWAQRLLHWQCWQLRGQMALPQVYKNAGSYHVVEGDEDKPGWMNTWLNPQTAPRVSWAELDRHR